jgi:NTE family protein
MVQTSTEPAAATTTSQPNTKPADLVLEGGGVKGIGLVGAILTLDQAGYSFKRVAGTSAGAIAAAIVAALQRAGRPLTEAQSMVNSIDYPRFMEKSQLRKALGPLGDAEQLLFHMGLYNGDYLIEWLGKILSDLDVVHFGDLPLEDEGADRNLQDYQKFTLVVDASDISRGRCVRLPWDYPQYGLDPAKQRIVDAVRASMSIPFFFQPVQFPVHSVTINGQTLDAGRITWVDGGLLANFPVDVFDRTDGAQSRWPTIGIRLSAKQAHIKSAATDNPVDEAIACLHTLLENSDRYYMTGNAASRTIFVDNAGISATDFGLDKGQRQTLYQNGVDAANAWLQAHL